MYATFECTGAGGQYEFLIKPINKPAAIKFEVGAVGRADITIRAEASAPIKRIIGLMNFEYSCENIQRTPNEWIFRLYVPSGELPATYFGSFSLMMSNTELSYQ